MLYVGPEGRRHGAHLELAGAYGRDPDADAIIARLAALVGRLPRSARRFWDRALAREFNIGVQAGRRPYSHELRLTTPTLAAVARLGGRIVITTYGVEPPRTPPRDGRRPAARARR